MCSPTVSLPIDKLGIGGFLSLTCSVLGGRAAASTSVLVQTTVFIVSDPGHLEYTRSCHHSETGETEASPPGSHQKSCND